jgi:hypothetical protein
MISAERPIHDLLALDVGDITHLAAKAHHAIRLSFNLAGRRRTGGSTTDVEGTHGELGTRLTDRLGCDDTDSLTAVDQSNPAQDHGRNTWHTGRNGFRTTAESVL